MAKKKVVKRNKNTTKNVSKKEIVVDKREGKNYFIIGIGIGVILIILLSFLPIFSKKGTSQIDEEIIGKPCTREYIPVCGSDNHTYANSCLAENAMVDYSRGLCEERVFCTAEQREAIACTMDYRPVCGDDGVSYGNKCSACAGKSIEFYVEGVCPGFEEFEE